MSGHYEHKATARERMPWGQVAQPVPPDEDPDWELVTSVLVGEEIHDTWKRYWWPPARPEQPGAPIPKKFRESEE